jgi:hypothetical protein
VQTLSADSGQFSYRRIEIVRIKKLISASGCCLAVSKSVWTVCPHLYHPERVYLAQSGRYVIQMEKESPNQLFECFDTLRKCERGIAENVRNLSRFLSALEEFLMEMVARYAEIVRREGRFESARTYAYEPLRLEVVLLPLRRQLQMPVGLGYPWGNLYDLSCALILLPGGGGSGVHPLVRKARRGEPGTSHKGV